MEQPIKIPATLLMLAKRHGYVILAKRDLDDHLAVTSAVLGVAFRMYDALETIGGMVDQEGSFAAAAALARSAQQEVDRQFWHTDPGGS